MHTLLMSYNKIPPSHLEELSKIPNLKCLSLASNDLLTLPDSMNYFSHLEELDLSSNTGFSSESILVNICILRAIDESR